MEDNKIKEKFIEYVESDIMKRSTFGALIVVGIFFVIISDFFSVDMTNFLVGLGVPLIVGTVIGYLAGEILGWPMGLWIGIIGGLFISPLVSLVILNGVAAYFSSFFGPLIGAFVGRLTELKDKWRISDRVEEMREESKVEEGGMSEYK